MLTCATVNQRHHPRTLPITPHPDQCPSARTRGCTHTKSPASLQTRRGERQGGDRALQHRRSSSRSSDGLPRRKEEQHCPKQSSMICLGVQTALGAVALNT